MALGFANSRVPGRTRRGRALAAARLAAVLAVFLSAGARAQLSALQITTPQFPLTPVGQSVTQNVTITVATGGNQVVFSSITLAPSVSDYSLGTITGCVVDGSTVNTDGTTCTIPVTFTPTLPGNAGAPQPIARTVALAINDVENYFSLQYSIGIIGSATMPRAVIVPGNISDLVGNDQAPTTGYAGDNSYSPATAVFNNPTNMAVDDLGDIYISDTGNCVVRRIDKVTSYVTTVAGIDPSPSPNCGSGNDYTAPTFTPLNGNTGIALDAAGNLYIADTGNGAVREVNIATGLIYTVAGTLNNPGYGGDGGPANQAQLLNPQGIAVDGYGDIFIADTGNFAVREVNAASAQISTIAGQPMLQGSPSTEVPGSSATSFQLGQPQAVTVDSAGDVYIADATYSGVLEVIASTQTMNEVVALPGAPSSFAVDASDTLHFTLTGNCSVYKLPGGTLAPLTIAGSGSCTPNGDGGSALLAGLNNPTDVVVDGTGSLYILESDGVRFVDSTGTNITTIPFGSVQIYTTATQNVELFNGDVQPPPGGSSNMGVYYQGNLGVPFATTPPPGGLLDCSQATTSTSILLGPGSYCTLSFAFAPVTDGPFSTSTGLFELSNGGSTQVTQAINLGGTGTGTGPTATLTPSPVNVSAGSNAGTASAMVTLQNTSATTPLAITSVALTNTSTNNFTITGNTCPGTLAANASCTITIAFTPTSVGTVSQTLVVTDATAAGSQSVTINGTGTAATATLTPTSANLTGVVNESGTSVPFTLTNTSTTAGLSGIGIGFAQYNGYSISSTTCYTVVAPGQSCAINVSYIPVSTAATTNTLQVYSDASNGLQTAGLSGTSTAPVASLSGALTFPSTAAGSSSASQTITLTNTGTATLHISSIAYAGDYPQAFTVNGSACPATLPPPPSTANRCNITVTFNPTGPGGYTGSVAVTDDSGGQRSYEYVTQNVTLGGTSPTISGVSSFTIANTAFPATPVGAVETQNVTLTLNSASTVLQSIAIAGGFSEYTVDSFSGCTVDGATANPAGTVCTIVVSFTPATPGSMHNAPLVVTTIESGNAVPYYFGLTALGTGQIAALTPGIIGPYVAADGSFGAANPLSGLGGQATAASVGFFNGIAIDAAKNMYISDNGFDVIYKITPTGIISIYAGTPFAYGGYLQTLSGDGGPAINATLSYGGPLALDTAGNLYVGDTDSFGNERIRVIGASTGTINTVVGGGSGCAAQTDSFGDGCTGTQAVLGTGVGGSVTGLAFDSSGNLYFTATSAYTSGDVANVVNYAIRKWNPTTKMVSLVAGATGETPGTGADGGSAVGAQISPTTMAFDSNGNLLVVDNGVHVRQISPSGTISTIAGAPGSTPQPESAGVLPCTKGFFNSATAHSAGNGGPATQAKFCYLTGIAVDAANNIYLDDYSASEIRRIDSGTGIIVEVSGANSVQNEDFGDYNEVLGNNDGSARDASLRYPQDIRLDASANIYIMESEGEVRWINVSQSALDFTPSINPNPPYNREPVNVGTLTGPQQVTVVNAGNSGNVTFNGPFTAPPLFGIDTADYTRDTATADCISTTAGIAPGIECPVNIDFTPTVAGTPIQDTDSVSDNAGTQTITLIGYASGAAQVSLLPAIQILEGNVNTLIGPQTYTLTNNMSTSIAITGIALTGPNAANFSPTNTCGASVAANSSCTISVTFQAATAGQFLAQVNVGYSVTTTYGTYPGSLTANLLGLTGSPEGRFNLNVAAANPGLFGNVQVGASTTHSFEFVSTGNIALNIASVAIAGTNANQFAVTANNCPALLQPSATCTIAVTFSPTAVISGTPYSATLIVNDNAPDSPQSAGLSGSGLGYLLSVNEAVHVMDAPVLTPSTLLPVNEVVHVTDTPVNTPSTLLPVSETVHVSDQVAFPGAASVQVSFFPGSLSFGTITFETTSQQSLQVINSSSSALSLSALSLSGSSEFSLLPGTCASAIAAGSNCSLTIQFSATATGSAAAVLSVSGSATTVPISGSAVAILTVTPQSTSRNFGTANPAFTYAVTGFVNGDTGAVLTGAPTLSTTATLNSPAGVYPITATQATLSAPSTYSFSFASASLTVNGGAAQTITFAALPPSIAVGFHQLTLTAHSTSGLPISYAVSGPASISGSTLTLNGTGQVTVTASQSGNATFAPAANVVQSFMVTP
jgi:hypothetical protein